MEKKFTSANIGKLPSKAELDEAFIYHEDTGCIYYRDSYRPRGLNAKKRLVPVGEHRDDGYVRITFKGNRYFAHRIIWKMMTGEDPKGVIDHISRDNRDNSWENLRDATFSENARNKAPRKRIAA